MQKNRALVLMACLALLLMLAATTVTTATPSTQTDVTFKTPEDAITTYLEGIAEGDVAKILQACAIDEMSENFKFDLYIERLRALPPQGPAPSDSPFYIELNKAQFTAQLLAQVKFFTYGLLSGEEVSDGRVVMMDAEGASEFMQAVDSTRLADIKLEQIGIPNQTVMNGERYKANATKLAVVYGADESIERVVLFSFEGDYYMIGFSLLRYGDNWKINNQSSPLAGTSALGTPTKTTKAEFDNLISK